MGHLQNIIIVSNIKCLRFDITEVHLKHVLLEPYIQSCEKA